MRTAAALVAVTVLLAGCAGSPQPTPDDPAAGSRSAAADLDFLLQELEAIHPEPFHGVSREEFVTELRGLQDRLPELDDDQAVVESMRLVALLSREGRDGHQFALPQEGRAGEFLPLRWYELDGGLVVTAAMPPYDDLVGAQVRSVDGVPVDRLLALAEPLVPRDGPATVPLFRPMLLLRTQVLRGLGVADDGAVTLSVATRSGVRERDLEPVGEAEHEAWAGRFGGFRLPQRPDVGYLSRLGDVQRTEWLGRVLYLRLTEVQETPDAALLRRLRRPDVERLVVDLRQNPGGDNTNNPAMVAAVADFAGTHPRSEVVVLTDRVTFSAASNLATELERAVDPVFVGEPMGGGLNFWDDVTPVRLDAMPVPLEVGVSTRYWEISRPGDPRLTIQPDVPVPVTAGDVLAGRDPALRTALGPLP
ncbi:hypothetical protein [Nocardioides sp. GXQ0305]|uniref:hypothetical protein n=1 Tax=Nocardioides sp. GXQ0305 TaxID=3423912 RepID=UPI003D7DBD2A